MTLIGTGTVDRAPGAPALSSCEGHQARSRENRVSHLTYSEQLLGHLDSLKGGVDMETDEPDALMTRTAQEETLSWTERKAQQRCGDDEELDEHGNPIKPLFTADDTPKARLHRLQDPVFSTDLPSVSEEELAANKGEVVSILEHDGKLMLWARGDFWPVEFVNSKDVKAAEHLMVDQVGNGKVGSDVTLDNGVVFLNPKATVNMEKFLTEHKDTTNLMRGFAVGSIQRSRRRESIRRMVQLEICDDDRALI